MLEYIRSLKDATKIFTEYFGHSNNFFTNLSTSYFELGLIMFLE